MDVALGDSKFNIQRAAEKPKASMAATAWPDLDWKSDSTSKFSYLRKWESMDAESSVCTR